MLSSTTWRLTLKSTNLFQTCLFFSPKTKTDFFAMFVCCCGGAPPCDWQLCQAARRCDYSISPFCPFFANHHQSYHWIIAQFCTYKAEAWQALLVLPLYMLDFSIAHLKHDYSISPFCPFFCHHHQSSPNHPSLIVSTWRGELAKNRVIENPSSPLVRIMDDEDVKYQ